jgi:hypothetical protein
MWLLMSSGVIGPAGVVCCLQPNSMQAARNRSRVLYFIILIIGSASNVIFKAESEKPGCDRFLLMI